jgi:hypothetical protein
MARGSEDCEHTVCNLVEYKFLGKADWSASKTKSKYCADLKKRSANATTNKREEVLHALSMAGHLAANI